MNHNEIVSIFRCGPSFEWFAKDNRCFCGQFSLDKMAIKCQRWHLLSAKQIHACIHNFLGHPSIIIWILKDQLMHINLKKKWITLVHKPLDEPLLGWTRTYCVDVKLMSSLGEVFLKMSIILWKGKKCPWKNADLKGGCGLDVDWWSKGWGKLEIWQSFCLRSKVILRNGH